ncbi:hypothetical protein CXIVA_15400 [Clostridium sp. SY8519]|nr:hypothetical protein CXIVA_15400 [Clostridium sp. SY8519]
MTDLVYFVRRSPAIRETSCKKTTCPAAENRFRHAEKERQNMSVIQHSVESMFDISQEVGRLTVDSGDKEIIIYCS